MELFIRWVAFAGAWLLFAGPIYQAALELGEEGLEREHLQSLVDAVPQPPPISAWWWLVPPVKILRQRARSRQFRAAFAAALSPGQRESLMTYLSKSLAWMMVAVGGLCIATKETWELAHHDHWPDAVFWAVVVAMAVASIVHTAARIRRTEAAVRPPGTRG